MTASRFVTRLGLLACLASLAVDPVGAQNPTSGAEALRKAGVLERLAGSAATPNGGPGFVLDPAWPKPLPNNWIIGDIGGLAWTGAITSGSSIGRAPSRPPTPAPRARRGKTRRDSPISAIGHPRPFGQLSGCCVPAPSVLEFDKAGTLLQAWGGPADPGFLDKKCRAQDGCTWPAREHGIFVDHNDFVYISGNGQAANFRGQFPWAPNFGNDSHILKFRSDGTFVYQIGTAGAKGPEQQRHQRRHQRHAAAVHGGRHERRSQDQPPLRCRRLR